MTPRPLARLRKLCFQLGDTRIFSDRSASRLFFLQLLRLFHA